MGGQVRPAKDVKFANPARKKFETYQSGPRAKRVEHPWHSVYLRNTEIVFYFNTILIHKTEQVITIFTRGV